MPARSQLLLWGLFRVRLAPNRRVREEKRPPSRLLNPRFLSLRLSEAAFARTPPSLNVSSRRRREAARPLPPPPGQSAVEERPRALLPHWARGDAAASARAPPPIKATDREERPIGAAGGRGPERLVVGTTKKRKRKGGGPCGCRSSPGKQLTRQ